MKTFRFALLLSLGLSATTWSQDAWLWQNPKPTGVSLNGVHFPVNGNPTGWVVGHSGTILKTTNGGGAWNLSTNQWTSANLEGVWFTNLQTGWAVGGGSAILKTTNGGTDWSTQSSSGTQDLKAVHFLNDNLGTAVGYSGTTGVVKRTSNGGTTWTSVTVSQARFTAVRLIDDFVGYAAGLGGVLYKTVDQGVTWMPLTSTTTQDLRSIHFSDADRGWVVGANGTVLTTTDGGDTWTSATSGTTRSLASVRFSTSARGYAVGDSGLVLKTTNGGTSWTQSTTGGANLRAVHVTADTVYAVGETGRMVRTRNAGSAWTVLSAGVGATINALQFPTASTGFAVGPRGSILKSTDQGLNWSALVSGITDTLTALHFTDSLRGYVVGVGGVVRKTTDGGQSWTALTSGTTNRLSAVYFATPMKGWIAGASGLIRATNDGGTTWTTPTVSTTTQNFLSISFATPAVGWVVGGTAIRKTTDSGATWTTQSSNRSSMVAVHAIDASNVIIARNSGLYKSTDGGSNWTSISISGVSGNLRSIKFQNAAQGYISSAAGTVGASSDSGRTWTLQSVLGSAYALNAVTVTPGGRVFVGGTDGAILTPQLVPPSNLQYAGAPFTYGLGSAITPQTPTFTGIATSFSVAPALPTGLTLNATTGVLSGTPTVSKALTAYNFTATNDAGTTTFTTNISVLNPFTAFQYSVSQLTLTRDVALSPLTPTITGVTPFGPYSCSSSPALPSGLALEPSTCVVSGAPVNAQAAANYIITLTNGIAAYNRLDTLRISVVGPPSNFSYSAPSPTYTVGQAITPNTATLTVQPGVTVRFSVTPALPLGLVLDTVTGTISGTPTKGTAATNHVISAVSSAGTTTATVRITVNGPPSDLTYPALVFGVNVPDTGRSVASVNGTVTRWTVTPELPAGLRLDTLSGKISGTSSAAVSSSAHTITAHNTFGSTSAAMTIAVRNPIILFSYSTKSFNLVQGTAMTAVSPLMAGTIPFTPVTFTVVPPLPSGLTLNASTGALSGTPAPGVIQTAVKHAVTANNGVAAFEKTDTLTITVTESGVIGLRGADRVLLSSVSLFGQRVAIEPPAETRTLRVTLLDMRGRKLLDRTVSWPNFADLSGSTSQRIAASGLHFVQVRFLNENGATIGVADRRVLFVPESR